MKSPLLCKLILVSICLSYFSSSSFAADIKNGKSKSVFCQHCHGVDGNSKDPRYPSLAGQQTAYLFKQLQDFQTGLRTNYDMQRLTAYLSKEDMSDISSYFSSLSSISAGKNSALARKGKNKVAMCLGCHGPSAQGRARTPKLAGQRPEYLKKQLLKFKNRSRNAGPMNSIAASLTDQDIKEIAAYLSIL